MSVYDPLGSFHSHEPYFPSGLSPQSEYGLAFSVQSNFLVPVTLSTTLPTCPVVESTCTLARKLKFFFDGSIVGDADGPSVNSSNPGNGWAALFGLVLMTLKLRTAASNGFGGDGGGGGGGAGGAGVVEVACGVALAGCCEVAVCVVAADDVCGTVVGCVCADAVVAGCVTVGTCVTGDVAVFDTGCCAGAAVAGGVYRSSTATVAVSHSRASGTRLEKVLMPMECVPNAMSQAL